MMQDEEKLYCQHENNFDKMAFTRIIETIWKISIYCFGALFLFFLIHMILAFIIHHITILQYIKYVFNIDTLDIIKKFNLNLYGTEYVGEICQISSDEDKINLFDASFLVGVGSVWVTSLTMFQQHITRYQDRAMNFPEMRAYECEFLFAYSEIIKKANVVHDSSCNMLMILRFKQAFPRYYTPHVLRMWVFEKDALSVYGVRAQKLEIQGYGSTLQPSKENGFCIEVAFQNAIPIIQDYCARAQTDDQNLYLIIDIQWTNNLMKGIMRKSSFYIRNIIVLNGKKDNVKEANIYGIKTINLTGAPLFGGSIRL